MMPLITWKLCLPFPRGRIAQVSARKPCKKSPQIIGSSFIAQLFSIPFLISDQPSKHGKRTPGQLQPQAMISILIQAILLGQYPRELIVA
jgi:hypothetical protein